MSCLCLDLLYRWGCRGRLPQRKEEMDHYYSGNRIWAKALCDAITATPRYRVGSFSLALASAALLADGPNLHRLAQGFPGLVWTLEAWERIGFDYLEALADGDEGAMESAYLEYQERTVADHERNLAESEV